MLKKLLKGELPLKATFWKFGVLGIVFINILVKIFGGLLAQKLKGISIYTYYTKYFNPVSFETTTVIYTACYLASLFILVAYSYILILGVWRSAAEYDRSLWLRNLAKLIILVFVYISFRNIF